MKAIWALKDWANERERETNNNNSFLPSFSTSHSPFKQPIYATATEKMPKRLNFQISALGGLGESGEGEMFRFCRRISRSELLFCCGMCFSACSQSIADVPWCRIANERITRKLRHSLPLTVIYVSDRSARCLDVPSLKFIAAPKGERNCANEHTRWHRRLCRVHVLWWKLLTWW